MREIDYHIVVTSHIALAPHRFHNSSEVRSKLQICNYLIRIRTFPLGRPRRGPSFAMYLQATCVPRHASPNFFEEAEWQLERTKI